MGKEGAKPAKAAKADPNLSADVLKFASSLGLVSGGGGGDNAFDDFAPQKAKQPIKKPADWKKAGTKGGGEKKKKDQDEAPAPVGDSAKVRSATKEEGEGKTKGREWNFGVGPRPGILKHVVHDLTKY